LLQQNEIPVYNENGKVILVIKTYQKLPFKALKWVNGTLQAVGWFMTGLSALDNTYQWATDQISTLRYSYRISGTTATTATALTADGPIALLVGGITILGEVSYDTIKYINKTQEEARRISPNHRNHRNSWEEVPASTNWYINNINRGNFRPGRR
jgi:hypothetical protein